MDSPLNPAHILIVHASKHGQTKKIAYQISEWIRSRGLKASVQDISSLSLISLKDYDGVLIGTPVYLGHTNKKLQQWVSRNRDSLSLLETGLFTVSLNAASQTPEAPKANQEILEEFQKLSRWRAGMTATFIGALNYREYNPILRFFLKRISKKEGGPVDTSRDYELTRWEDVEAFALRFLEQFSVKHTEGRVRPEFL